MSRLRTAVLLLAAAGLAGCFDVHSAPGALLIDDFDSSDMQPFDPSFGKWTCQAISTDAMGISCGVASDTLDHSAGAYLSMTVTDPMNNGLQDHVGASLETGATMGAVDFTQYQRLTFDIELVSGGMYALPANALVYLELGCASASPESGAARNDLYVLQGVDYQAFWKTDSLTLGNFGPPPWLKTPIQGGTEACLQQVTAVRFSIDSQLADGSTGSAVLYIDNVALQ